MPIGHVLYWTRPCDTVNSEFFARVYFRENSRSFRKKPSRNGDITQPFTYVGTCKFKVANMSPNFRFFEFTRLACIEYLGQSMKI